MRHTALHEDHKKLGARLVPFAGWEMPIQYQGISAEHQAVRERAGLFDVSHMGELDVRGSRAVPAVNRLVTNDQGTILDDLIVYRRSPEHVLVVCNASNRDKISSHFARAIGGECDFRDVSDETALIALQGPRALAVLNAAGSNIDVAGELRSFRFKDGSVAGTSCTIARTGYTGEDGVEIFCAWGDSPRLWNALLEAGKADGISAVGLGARDTLRLEARLSLYGNEIDETTNPIEAGLAWTVKLDKSEFVGKAAISEIKARGTERTLVGFEMTDRGIARHGYPLLDRDGKAVGICTSGGPSPTLGKNIGLGYLPIALSQPGSDFLVDCRGKSIAAVVVKTPFYKRGA